jgi:hypothetical protein
MAQRPQNLNPIIRTIIPHSLQNKIFVDARRPKLYVENWRMPSKAPIRSAIRKLRTRAVRRYARGRCAMVSGMCRVWVLIRMRHKCLPCRSAQIMALGFYHSLYAGRARDLSWDSETRQSHKYPRRYASWKSYSVDERSELMHMAMFSRRTY